MIVTIVLLRFRLLTFLIQSFSLFILIIVLVSTITVKINYIVVIIENILQLQEQHIIEKI